jgi:hypothetical protein
LILWTEPGGYLQWNELDVVSRRIIKADPMASAEKLNALVDFASGWEDKLGPKESVVLSLSPAVLSVVGAFPSYGFVKHIHPFLSSTSP